MRLQPVGAPDVCHALDALLPCSQRCRYGQYDISTGARLRNIGIKRSRPSGWRTGMPRASFGTTVEALYSAATAQSGWSEALECFADHLDAEGAFFVDHRFSTGHCRLEGGRLREDLTELYKRDFLYNDMALAVAQQPGHGVFVGSRLVSRKYLLKTPLYDQILRPQNVVDQIITNHPNLTRDGNTGGFGVNLTPRQADNVEARLVKVERLKAHLWRAFDLSASLASAIEAKAQAQAQMRSLIEAMAGAVILLDVQARIVLANSTAEALLRRGDGLSVERAPPLRLTASYAADRRRLAALVNSGLAAARGGEEPLIAAQRIGRPSGRMAYIVLATPLPAATTTIWAVREGPCMMLRIVEPDAETQAPTAILADMFGLTPAEARTCALIASGMSTPQVAKMLGVGVTTIRTHLARCFDKTGVRSQPALARLLAVLPGQA